MNSTVLGHASHQCIQSDGTQRVVFSIVEDDVRLVHIYG